MSTMVKGEEDDEGMKSSSSLLPNVQVILPRGDEEDEADGEGRVERKEKMEKVFSLNPL